MPSPPPCPAHLRLGFRGVEDVAAQRDAHVTGERRAHGLEQRHPPLGAALAGQLQLVRDDEAVQAEPLGDGSCVGVGGGLVDSLGSTLPHCHCSP